MPGQADFNISLCYKTIKLSLSFAGYNHSYSKKVQVGKDQEKAQSEKDSYSKNRGGKKPN